MGAMSFEVPDGASVQIIVGKAAPLALSDDGPSAGADTKSRLLADHAERSGGGRFTRWWLRGWPAFEWSERVGQAWNRAGGGNSGAGSRSTAFPDHPLATDHPSPAPAPMSDQVPPTFTQQLQQPPTVVPPPGQPTGAGAGEERLRPGQLDMVVARKILGPQEQFERTGAQGMRDVRPFTTRLSEGLRSSASGLVLSILAGVTYFEPAALDVTVPLSALYALRELTRPVKLPGRVPGTATCLDYSNLEPGTRKPKPASATWLIGWDIHGHELWVTPEDVRQHIAIPGTTGAGKTTAIRSLLVNALAEEGSGFVFVDGKADRGLFSQVFALARRFGREDDLRVLNFPVASDAKDSNSFNPFSVGNADTARELLASQLGEKAENDANGVFRDRAGRLDRHHCTGAGLAARSQGHPVEYRGDPLLDRTALDLEARHGADRAVARSADRRHLRIGCGGRDSGGYRLAPAVLSRRAARL